MSADVAVVCFGVGGERFAIASADVVGLDRDADNAESLAELMALPSADRATRTITIAASGWLRTFVVDTPIEVRTVTAAAVVAPPPGLVVPLVVGFARLDQRWVQLLDTEALVTVGRTGAPLASPLAPVAT